MGAISELRHTADVGFEVEAGTLGELFRLAARGLSAALGLETGPDGAASPGPGARGEDPGRAGEGPVDRPEARPSGSPPTRLDLRRPDLDRLLVAFLKEILYHASRLGARPTVAAVEVDREEEGAALRAVLEWEAMGPDALEREIKGVTYHGLRVEQEGSRWHARVVLDV